jgi:NAD(P)-dependent dehydrogenase (short-subunit alcohol dehydrogenase family)
LKDEGFTVLLIHPGWVATDMGKQIKGGQGAKTTEQSASDILKVLANLKTEQSGSYLRETGEPLNW